MANIVDQFGNPIRFKQRDLKESQTSRLAALQKEFAGHPSRGLTPQKLASILDAAELGNIQSQHELFLDMEEKDAHIFSEMSKRRRALLGLDWSIEPPRNPTAQEERITDELREWFHDVPDIEDIILDLGDGIGHGFACLEIEWLQYGKIHLPGDIEHRPQSWFQLDQATRSELRLRDGSMDGEELQPFTWMVHTHRAKPGYLTRGGLHRVLAWPYLFKNYSVRDLAEFLEIYGLPIKVGTFPGGATEEEKLTLLRALVGIGHNAAGVIPEGMQIDFQSAVSGHKDPFEAMINWCERAESKAILGATLTSQTDSGSGAMALGNVHNEVRMDLRDSDARQFEGTITRDLLYPIVAVNGRVTDPRRCPRFKLDTQEPEDLKFMAEALPPLVNIGLQVPVKWAQDKLRIPQPEEGEAVLGALQIQPPPAPGTAAAKGATAPRERDVVDAYVDQLQATTEPALDDMINRVRQILDEVDSLDAFEQRLLEAFNYLEPDELAGIMRMGMATAELAGRYEVQEGQ